MSTSRWTILRKVRGNHKWFRCKETGRVACADNSGMYPNQTDDGILWLNKEKPIVMGTEDHRIWVSTPVIKANTDEQLHIISGLAEVLYLMREHEMELRIEPGGDDESGILMAKCNSFARCEIVGS